MVTAEAKKENIIAVVQVAPVAVVAFHRGNPRRSSLDIRKLEKQEPDVDIIRQLRCGCYRAQCRERK
jgi:hypothetical protein